MKKDKEFVEIALTAINNIDNQNLLNEIYMACGRRWAKLENKRFEYFTEEPEKKDSE